MERLDLRGVHVGLVERPAPKRPWDVRFRQWLLTPDRLVWLAVLVMAIVVTSLMWRLP